MLPFPGKHLLHFVLIDVPHPNPQPQHHLRPLQRPGLKPSSFRDTGAPMPLTSWAGAGPTFSARSLSFSNKRAGGRGIFYSVWIGSIYKSVLFFSYGYYNHKLRSLTVTFTLDALQLIICKFEEMSVITKLFLHTALCWEPWANCGRAGVCVAEWLSWASPTGPGSCICLWSHCAFQLGETRTPGFQSRQAGKSLAQDTC